MGENPNFPWLQSNLEMSNSLNPVSTSIAKNKLTKWRSRKPNKLNNANGRIWESEILVREKLTGGGDEDKQEVDAEKGELGSGLNLGEEKQET